MKVKLTNGTTTVTLETIVYNTTANGTWRHRTFANISSLLPLTTTMKMIVEIADYTPGHVVEGGLDKFQVLGALATGINESISAVGQLNAEGNPFRGSTSINYNLADENKIQNSIVVSDILGNIVEKHSLSTNSGKISVGGNLSAGVYFVSLMNENGINRSLKIVKTQ